MNKLIFAAAVILISSAAFSQSAYIKHSVDKMDGSESYTFSKRLKFISGTKWFAIDPILTKDESSKIKCTGLYITYSGIGSCNENDEMDFLFGDGSKMKIKAWNRFGCKNNSAFFIDSANIMGDCLTDINLLNKPMQSIRFTNGRTYDNMTANTLDKNFFVELNSVLQKQSVKN